MVSGGRRLVQSGARRSGLQPAIDQTCGESGHGTAPGFMGIDAHLKADMIIQAWHAAYSVRGAAMVLAS
ncbi:hypothetical protein D3C81_2264380 [compost metagenome]